MGNICNQWCPPPFCPNQSRRRGSSILSENEIKFNSIESMYNELSQLSNKDGITKTVFIQHVFSRYPILSERIFNYMMRKVESNSLENELLTNKHFERNIMRIINNNSLDNQVMFYVRVYSDDEVSINRNNFKSMLLVVYNISVDYHPDVPVRSRLETDVIEAAVEAAFGNKTMLSIKSLTNWILGNVPRFIAILHGYVVNVFSTGYIEKTNAIDTYRKRIVKRVSSSIITIPRTTIPVQHIWILSNTLTNIYTNAYNRPIMQTTSILTEHDINNFLAYNIDLSIPTHWKVLYRSNEDGLSPNRFMNQILGYDAPTIMFLKCERNLAICLCASMEWHESSALWGDANCFIIELLPLYQVLDRSILIYSNFTVHGVRHGIFAGSNRREPILLIDDSFAELTYQNNAYKLHSIEVWGCGSEEHMNSFKERNKWRLRRDSAEHAYKLNSKSMPYTDRFLLDLNQ